MIDRMKNLALVAILVVPMTTLAAGGGEAPEFQTKLDNTEALQRGAALFTNYCLSCHSASYMRYNRLGSDLGISDDLIRENLLFAGDKVGDYMKSAMPKDDSKSWFGVTPPDLSTIARARGAGYLYAYMKGFYRDEKTANGWNNTMLENAAMPHVLWELQGVQRAVMKETDGEPVVDHFELVEPGTMTELEYDSAIRDLTNFMVYLAEPAKLSRYKIGFWTILFLLILLPLTYLLKKEYWRDVH